MSTENKFTTQFSFFNIFVIWGVTFLAISYGLKGFPPFILSGFRFTMAGLLLLGWMLTKGERVNSLANLKKNAITGLLILTGGTGLVVWSEQYVSSTEAAIAIATGPFWFIAIDRKNWKLYFSDIYISTGLLIGFIGLLLFLKGSVHESATQTVDSSKRVIAFIVLAISSIAWVLGSLYSKNNPSTHSKYMNIAQQLTTAGIASFIIALVRNEYTGFHISEVPTSAWIGLLFLVFIGSIVAYVSYIYLLSVKPAALVSTHTYINPIVAVVFGWLVSNEVISQVQFIGLFIILIGVLFVNFNTYKISKYIQLKIVRYNRKLIRSVRVAFNIL